MMRRSSTARVRELVQRDPLPEHGWASPYGAVCAFEHLPRFARYAIAWAFTWRLWTLQTTLLAWLVTLLATSLLLGVLLLPAGIFIMLTAAPYWALRWTLHQQLGPFHIRAVTDSGDATPSRARALDRGPPQLIDALDSTFMWRTIVAAGLGLATVLMLGLLLCDLGVKTRWPAALALVWSMLATFPAYYHGVAMTLRTHWRGRMIRLVG